MYPYPEVRDHALKILNMVVFNDLTRLEARPVLIITPVRNQFALKSPLDMVHYLLGDNAGI